MAAEISEIPPLHSHREFGTLSDIGEIRRLAKAQAGATHRKGKSPTKRLSENQTGNGLNNGTPVACMSRTFLVTSVMPLQIAVAAICESMTGSEIPAN